VLFLIVALTSLTIALIAYGASLLKQPELDTVDARFSIRGTQPVPSDIVVVAIDDVTFNELHRQWPFPRSLHAKLIDRLRRSGAKTIVYDVQFTEPTKPVEDNALIEAVYRARPVVLATTEVSDRGEANIFGGADVLRQIQARAGNALVPPDQGSVIRRVPYEVGGLQSLSIVTAQVVRHHGIDASSLGGSKAWIDYRGPPGTFKTISFSRVLSGKVDPELLRGKIVVVGPSSPTLQDVHPTSTAGGELMSGAEVQANAISTALRGFPLKNSPAWLDVLLISLFALLAPLGGLRLPPLRALAIALVIGWIYAVGVQVAFNNGIVLPFVYPLGALALSSVGSLGVHYLTVAFERERVREIFSRFVPDQVVEQVLATTDEDLRLGGVRRQATVMFCDLRGFTSFAESLPAEQVIKVVNFYLDLMTDAILNAGGTLVAYMGDGIMAIFGAPIAQEDHPDRAIKAAREMLGDRLPRFNAWLRDQGLGDGFRMGIGLNSGEVMSGNVGSERRLEYTAIGDTTNTAARLEGMTKGTPHQIFIAESTCSSLTRPADDLVYVDEFDVRGRQSTIKVWSLPAPEQPPGAPSVGEVFGDPVPHPFTDQDRTPSAPKIRAEP
jgi:adenylate cyclase